MANDSIKVSIDIIDKAADAALKNLISKGNEAEKGLKKVGDSGSSAFSEITVHLGKATGLYDIFVGNLAANLATKAFDTLVSAASKLFQTFVVDGVKAAQAQEEATNELNQALARTGMFSKETAKEMDEFASSLQATTGVEDDLITKNAALIQNLAQLDKDGLKRTTEAALNLSAALGKDLSTASEALGKAANGNVTALQKMGLKFEKGITTAQTFENALKAIEHRFDGAAAAKVNTYAGSVALVSNSFGDLQEEVGNSIVKNTVVVTVMKQVGEVLNRMSAYIKDNNQAFRELVGQGIVMFLKGLSGLAAGADAIIRVFRVLTEVIAQPFKIVATALGAATQVMDGEFRQAYTTMKDGVKDSFKEIKAAATDDTWATKIGDALAGVQGAAEGSLVAVKKGAVASIEPMNQVKAKTTELSEEQKKYNQELLNWVANLAKANSDGQLLLQSRIEDLRLQKEQELITEQEFLTLKGDAELAQLELEQQRLDEANSRKIGSETMRADAQISLDEKVKRAKLKNAIELNKAEEELNKQKIRATADTFGNLASLMQTSSRELFAIGKAAAIAQASINSYEAITKTMAFTPYPFNIPLAVAQGIAGAVQVANIAKQNPSFEQGGIVPGSSFSGDRVSANVNSGEMILNRSQQSELFKVANGAGGGVMNEVRDLMRALLMKDERVVVNVGGRTIVDTLRSELNAGRSFA